MEKQAAPPPSRTNRTRLVPPPPSAPSSRTSAGAGAFVGITSCFCGNSQRSEGAFSLWSWGAGRDALREAVERARGRAGDARALARLALRARPPPGSRVLRAHLGAPPRGRRGRRRGCRAAVAALPPRDPLDHGRPGGTQAQRRARLLPREPLHPWRQVLPGRIHARAAAPPRGAPRARALRARRAHGHALARGRPAVGRDAAHRGVLRTRGALARRADARARLALAAIPRAQAQRAARAHRRVRLLARPAREHANAQLQKPMLACPFCLT